jgi:hypothetical protein
MASKAFAPVNVVTQTQAQLFKPAPQDAGPDKLSRDQGRSHMLKRNQTHGDGQVRHSTAEILLSAIS